MPQADRHTHKHTHIYSGRHTSTNTYYNPVLVVELKKSTAAEVLALRKYMFITLIQENIFVAR